eukprot:TRINITY_DN22968_c0_g1_i1.p1 TRINITY_DN22968_c0_g1~~TRINITY_DN22968_c0_g1_i1.p1  ORF type:complete len:417 (+),score=126.91 TRINITY_DN22968_c0_g1_i1:93-1253(+)
MWAASAALLLAATAAPSELTCHSIASGTSDSWCQSNCNHQPPFCPTDLCKCDGPSPPPAPSPTPSPPQPPGPSPQPPPPVPPTPPAPPSPPGLLDVIGYYGNSGNAVSSIPKFSGIHEDYNVVIITFASVDSAGAFSIDIQGPYDGNLPAMAADIADWKKGKDKYGRRRLVLVSVGGQNGQWPSGLPADTILAGLNKFMTTYNLDGLDIDLEGGAVSSAKSLIPVVQSLTKAGKVVTAAPEAAQSPLGGYVDLLQHLTWVHPQFYNNGPNGVTDPYVPPGWPQPWTVSDWQAERGGQSFWAGVLGAIAKHDGLSQQQQGMLIPATRAAAGSYNNWDIAKLASEVKAAGIGHVGCWAIAYDNTQGWKFAKTLGALNGALANATARAA